MSQSGLISIVGPHRDVVGGHQVDADERQNREDGVKNADHGAQAFGEFWRRRHDSGENHTKDVDGRQAQERLDAERLEYFGTVVIQLVGEGQNPLECPNHGHGEAFHGSGRHVFSQFVGNHDEGVQQVPQKEEETLTANDAIDSHEHGNARDDRKYVHERRIKVLAESYISDGN